MRLIGGLLILQGLLAYVPGLDFGLTFNFGKLNLSFVFCLLGLGVWQCDHTSRRVLLGILHLPVLSLGLVGHALMYNYLSPDFSVATKSLDSFEGWAYLALLAGVVFAASYLPALVLSGRKVKLLFAPSRAKKGLPVVYRETVKRGVSVWTIPSLAALSASVGMLVAATEEMPKMRFLDVDAFESRYAEELGFIRSQALFSSKQRSIFASSTEAKVLEGTSWYVWMEPAYASGNFRGFSRHILWPLVDPEGGSYSFSKLTLLPGGYEFKFPVWYEGEAYDEVEGRMRPVRIFRDWIQADESSQQLQVVIVEALSSSPNSSSTSSAE